MAESGDGLEGPGNWKVWGREQGYRNRGYVSNGPRAQVLGGPTKTAPGQGAIGSLRRGDREGGQQNAHPEPQPTLLSPGYFRAGAQT